MSEWETCSWCTDLVLDSSLREAQDGARICSDCQKDENDNIDLYGLDYWKRY